jgi:Leucine-rich repeat (LRR) protein
MIVLGLVPSCPIFGANGSSTCLHQWWPHSKVLQKGFTTQKIPGFSCQFCAKFLTSLPLQSIQIQKKSLTEEILEKAIRKHLWKPTSTLTMADFAAVKWLVLSHNNLTDVTGLDKLTQLKVLYLHNNQLMNVKGLEKLTTLETLWLGKNNLTDVDGLENLTELKVLFLNHNKLIDVKGLEKCKKLEWLRLDGNPELTKAQIDQLRVALPWWCKIISNPTK